eukprot:5039227-Amphidinium_carterae.1
MLDPAVDSACMVMLLSPESSDDRADILHCLERHQVDLLACCGYVFKSLMISRGHSHDQLPL